MIIIKKITVTLDNINKYIGEVTNYVVILLMLVVVFEVITRRFFSRPTIWSFEIITMLYGFHFMMLAGYAYLNKSLVNVDILYDKFSLKTKLLLDFFTHIIFFFPFVIIIIFGGTKFAYYALESGEKSWSAWAPIQWPIKMVIPISMFFLFLQGISEFLKCINSLISFEKNNI